MPAVAADLRELRGAAGPGAPPVNADIVAVACPPVEPVAILCDQVQFQSSLFLNQKYVLMQPGLCKPTKILLLYLVTMEGLVQAQYLLLGMQVHLGKQECMKLKILYFKAT